MLARGNANQLLLSRRTSTPATTYARTQRAVRRQHSLCQHSLAQNVGRGSRHGIKAPRRQGRASKRGSQCPMMAPRRSTGPLHPLARPTSRSDAGPRQTRGLHHRGSGANARHSRTHRTDVQHGAPRCASQARARRDAQRCSDAGSSTAGRSHRPHPVGAQTSSGHCRQRRQCAGSHSCARSPEAPRLVVLPPQGHGRAERQPYLPCWSKAGRSRGTRHTTRHVPTAST